MGVSKIQQVLKRLDNIEKLLCLSIGMREKERAQYPSLFELEQSVKLSKVKCEKSKKHFCEQCSIDVRNDCWKQSERLLRINELKDMLKIHRGSYEFLTQLCYDDLKLVAVIEGVKGGRMSKARLVSSIMKVWKERGGVDGKE